jgi:hypothetical protein
MYKIQSAKGCNLRNLPEASDKNSRITQIWDRDENGRRHRRYTVENIEGIVGIAILEHANPDYEYLKAPRAYLKIKCINIVNEDQKLLLPGGCAWVPKADLDGLFEAEVITHAITIAWDKQEARWLAYEEGAGRSSPDRLPSVCPLDAFLREKRSRTHSASPRSSAKSRSPKSKFRRSPSSIIIDSIETPANATSPVKRPVEVKREEADYSDLSAVPEQKEEDPDLFVQQPPTPTPNAAPRQSDVVNFERTSGQGEKREPLTFNVDSYLAQLRETEGWNTMTEKDQARRAARALKNYPEYKRRRLEIGDIEEEEEEEEEL